MSWRATPETIVLAALLAFSVLGLVFMGSLVAEPKLLFGRSLSALAPSLFPSIILTALALLCALLLFLLVHGEIQDFESSTNRSEWIRATTFFGIMLLYAVTMQPFGFLISSAIAVVLLSVLMGNRSPLQIGALACAGPVLLYLAATRLLAVSLPELHTIELAYARLLGG